MTANDMTNRDAAQIAALPKSAVWSRLLSGDVIGSGWSRSLTSERTGHTSSPATSGGHPKRLSLGRPEGACEEVRETMRKHKKHGSVAGVSFEGDVGGGRAVWQAGRVRGGVADPPHAAPLERHAGRAVSVTACVTGQVQRGGRPEGVHLSWSTSESRLTMRRHDKHASVAGVSFEDDSGGGRAVWHDGPHAGVAPPLHVGLERHAGRAVLGTACRNGRERGGHPLGVHLSRPPSVNDDRLGSWGGLRAGVPAGVHPARAYDQALDRRGGHHLGVHPVFAGAADPRPRSTGGSPSGTRHDRPLANGQGPGGGVRYGPPFGFRPRLSGSDGTARRGGGLIPLPPACRPFARQSNATPIARQSNKGLNAWGGRPTGAHPFRLEQ